MKKGLIKKRSKKSGLSPGSLIHIGDKKTDGTRITLIEYGEGHLSERVVTVDECSRPEGDGRVFWIDVEGLSDVEVLGSLGERFGIHPLVLEDILNTDQRPKMEDYGDYIYVVLKMLCPERGMGGVAADQVSIIFGPNYVISFQEGELDVFDPVRERIRRGKGRIRKMGASYLAYALVDAIVDSLFIVMEMFDERIERIEDELAGSPQKMTLLHLHALRRDMLLVKRAVWPLRELIGSLTRSESRLIGESVGIFLRDVYDHAVYLIDTVETFRDMLSGMLDVYLSSINYKLNEVIKVLTIIATVFMPLSFIVGIYGMNFRHMPELEWRFGYPAVWGVMIAVAGVMFAYFRKKEWL